MDEMADRVGGIEEEEILDPIEEEEEEIEPENVDGEESVPV